MAARTTTTNSIIDYCYTAPKQAGHPLEAAYFPGRVAKCKCAYTLPKLRQLCKNPWQLFLFSLGSWNMDRPTERQLKLPPSSRALQLVQVYYFLSNGRAQEMRRMQLCDRLQVADGVRPGAHLICSRCRGGGESLRKKCSNANRC